MKKKLIIISAIIFFIAFIVVGIKTIKIERVEVPDDGSQEVKMASEEILMQVLRGEKEFIDNDGKEITINSLNIEDVNVKINQYSFVDIDGDTENELVALTDSYYGYYLLLDIDSNIIYGYNVSLNDIDYINNIGIIYDKVDDSIYYRRLKFSKNSLKKINMASFVNGEYVIGKEVVEKDEFNNFENDFINKGLIKYKSISTKWMEKKINSEFSIKAYKTFEVSSDIDILFALDKEFSNFKNDLLEENINLYYMNSNASIGRVIIKRFDDNLDKYYEELSNKKSVCIYDEDSQYIVLVINNDIFDSDLDNNYEVYYFKYYNKGIQFLGKTIVDDYYSILNEDTVSKIQ